MINTDWLTVIEHGFVTELEAESASAIVNDTAPDWVGVPEIVPVRPSSSKPAGNCPSMENV